VSERSDFADDGFALLPAVYSADECAALAQHVHEALAACSDESASLRRAGGSIYGARNLLDLFPAAQVVWWRTPLVEFLAAQLGSEFGLVRGLYFDKPPGAAWSLPWHRDLTIAVRDHSLPTTLFRNPTTKAGVQHVEAPDEVLSQMLTLRIHLDDATPENGPLQVIPGSHKSRETNSARAPVTVLARAGDVLAMRPLVMHASGNPAPGTNLHRRVIHLEFTAWMALPDGYTWRQFIR
jgi:ectoine hydroxylase-related dioxygenase (phytanoyl-CoA dioxygenase family)